jgi:hypothetical protein
MNDGRIGAVMRLNSNDHVHGNSICGWSLGDKARTREYADGKTKYQAREPITSLHRCLFRKRQDFLVDTRQFIRCAGADKGLDAPSSSVPAPLVRILPGMIVR